jgi:hypothetical protein
MLRSWTLNETFMGRIRIATRSCLWIDPLVKPIRLTSLKRIAYDKPIRTQLIVAQLVRANDEHMTRLEHLADEAQLNKSTTIDKNEPVECIEHRQDQVEVIDDKSSTFKPFLNRRGQLIMNPLGRSKEFFSQRFSSSHDDNVQLSHRMPQLDNEHRLMNDEDNDEKTSNLRRNLCRNDIGHGQQINTISSIENERSRQTTSMAIINPTANTHRSNEHSSNLLLTNTQQASVSTDSICKTLFATRSNATLTSITQTKHIEHDGKEILKVIDDYLSNTHSY